jgi:hypothetical protein
MEAKFAFRRFSGRMYEGVILSSMTAAEPPAARGRADAATSSAPASSASSRSPSAAARARGRVPDFFIVGHPKSGTTALHEMLKRHPQIYMPDWKEPRYFASDLPYPIHPQGAGAPPKSYEDYLALFADTAPAQLAGEGSTAYIWSRTAARAIAEAQPAARIIALFREPASFMRSLHLQMLEHRSEDEPSLRKALALDDARRAGVEPAHVNPRWPQGVMYAERVRYVEQLRRFEALFAPEQMLVLIYDDFRNDNRATMRRVHSFLGVDDDVPFEAIEANPTVRRRVRLDDTVRTVVSGSGAVATVVRKTVKLVVPKRLRREAFDTIHSRMMYANPRQPDERFMLELRRRFKPEVQALGEHLDRDLVSLWGYDSLD